MSDGDETGLTRRGVMKGVGGLAALSMSNATLAQAQEVLSGPLPTDPHTRQTYRAIVDAIVPRTPQLEDELGPEHVPGGLDVELEKFIVWDFNHFQEVRLETLTVQTDSFDGSTPDAAMPVSMFEFSLDTTDFLSDFDALAEATGNDILSLDVDVMGLREYLDFGGIERFDLSLADDLDSSPEGPASFDLVVDRGSEVFRETYGDYPYAAAFPMAFDLVAAEFLAAGRNADQPAPNDEFVGGGTFTTLSREDRLRCLWDIVDGGSIDRLDSLLSPMLPQAGILKYVVMAVNGLHGFGYYTEWSGYGNTKTAEPSERQLEVGEDKVQSRLQTGYPGPKEGYAADWRHAVPGGFRDGSYNIDSDSDPFDVNLHLPDDLTGDDVVVGGDS